VTWGIVQELGGVLARVFQGKGLPGGIDVAGPVGIVRILSGSLDLGLPSYLSFLATLSIYLALFNILPIPAVDGGRLFFLGLEFLRKKPLSEKFEGRVTAVSFGLLIFLLLAVTFRDLTKLF
jgi:regulator of sigma E protease